MTIPAGSAVLINDWELNVPYARSRNQYFKWVISGGSRVSHWGRGWGASTPKAVTFRKKKKRFETKESGPLGGACAGHANGYCRVLNVIFTSHKGSFTLVRPSL